MRIALLLMLFGVAAAARESPAPPPPAQVYGALFEAVQNARLFPDSKTFADATARSAPQEILRRYEEQRNRPGFALRDFVTENFEIPAPAAGDFRTAPNEEIRAHIERLWSVLARDAHPEENPRASLLPMSARYVVPGDRFREMYYWDSYFTMVGLQSSGRHDLVADMVTNFASLIDRYGHVPNGTRSYYLSRSQPPFFAAMVALQAGHEGTRVLVARLPQLEREYAFWMDGAGKLTAAGAYRRVVRVTGGMVLNRYWDDSAKPRDEAWIEDVQTARGRARPAEETYRELRAAAESGWDFGSRWFADGKSLGSIHTTDFLPVDLNSLLYQLERTIARACAAARRADCDRAMRAHAEARRNAMLALMWDEELGAFVDYDWRAARRAPRITAATAYPLFADVVDGRRARRVAGALRKHLLAPHGLATTTEDTGQQWDAPNGWAPLQWIAIDGLRRHGQRKLAGEIATGWVRENARVYCRTGKLVEKYNVRDAGAGAGGEYPVQDGFGWTNGIFVKLLALYPKLARPRYEFTGAECAGVR
jgi:alpha,alpha-trehalase